MARVFSILFRYNGVERSAMIAVRSTPFATEYTITMVHDDLLEELPSQKIQSTPAGQLAFVNHSLAETTPLMLAILNGLKEYLATSV